MKREYGIKRLELGNGRFEVIRIGCMRFERLSKNGNPDKDRWVGCIEQGDVDLPVFASSKKAFTVELISKCCEEIEEFLKAVEAENKEPSSGSSNVSPPPIAFITYDLKVEDGETKKQTGKGCVSLLWGSLSRLPG